MNFFKYFDIRFLAKFLALFAGLYYFHIFYWGIVTPGGKLYSNVLAQHGDYIAGLTKVMLSVANFWTQLLGFNSYIVGYDTLQIAGGTNVGVEMPCLGLGVLSFWVAFISAHTLRWQNKLFWCIGGILAIELLNSWRITLILFSIEKEWTWSHYTSSHELFNYASYSVILFFIYLFYKKDQSAAKLSLNRTAGN